MSKLATLKMYLRRSEKLSEPTDIYAHKVKLLDGHELDLGTPSLFRYEPWGSVPTAQRTEHASGLLGLGVLEASSGNRVFQSSHVIAYRLKDAAPAWTLNGFRFVQDTHVAQQLAWDQGGYIIWGFRNYVDATSSKVHGLVPSAIRPLGWYTFTDVYLS